MKKFVFRFKGTHCFIHFRSTPDYYGLTTYVGQAAVFETDYISSAIPFENFILSKVGVERSHNFIEEEIILCKKISTVQYIIVNDVQEPKTIHCVDSETQPVAIRFLSETEIVE